MEFERDGRVVLFTAPTKGILVHRPDENEFSSVELYENYNNWTDYNDDCWTPFDGELTLKNA